MKKSIFCLIAFCWAQASAAQMETRICVDSSFSTETVFTGEEQLPVINTVLALVNGKIVVAGDFDYVSSDGQKRENIVRFNQDGSIDNTLVAIDNVGEANAIAEQADGKILVGGTLGLPSRPGFPGQIDMLRFNADGSVDSSFYFGFDIGRAFINAIEVQDDGKILVAGRIQQRNSEFRLIVRLNSDGSLDETFVTERSTNILSEINAISLQDDGKILIGGRFARFNTQDVQNIVRLNSDGSTDESFNATTGSVLDIAQLTDGSFLLGGSFSGVNGLAQRSLAKVLPEGGLDTTFTPALNNEVNSVGVLNDGRVLVNGRFSLVNGMAFKHLVLLDENGEVDPDFDFRLGTRSSENFIEIQQDGDILLGIAGGGITELVRLRTDCRLPAEINPGMIQLLLLETN